MSKAEPMLYKVFQNGWERPWGTFLELFSQLLLHAITMSKFYHQLNGCDPHRTAGMSYSNFRQVASSPVAIHLSGFTPRDSNPLFSFHILLSIGCGYFVLWCWTVIRAPRCFSQRGGILSTNNGMRSLCLSLSQLDNLLIGFRRNEMALTQLH